MADLSKIEIKKLLDSKEPLNGANVQILMDGVPLKGVTFFKLELKPNKLAKVVIEMIINDLKVDENIKDIEVTK